MTDTDASLEPGGAPRGANAHVEMIRQAIQVYRNGKTGIPFDVLAAFSGPILSHYQLDLDPKSSACITPANAGEMAVLVDVFESALMFWTYFAARGAGDDVSPEHLRASMISPEADLAETMEFDLLFEAMEEAFAALGGADSDQVGLDWRPPDGFDSAGPAAPDDEGNLFYDEEGTDQPESFALFARPLYDDLDDPDALERVTQLASAYWDLARCDADRRPAHLDALLRQFGRTPAEREQLEHEARSMIERYHTLFPAHGS